MSESKPPQEKGANVRFPPPLIYLISLAAGTAAERLTGPHPWLHEAGAWSTAVGWALLIAGVAAITMSFTHFKRTNQDPKPWKPTPEIIDTGIYGHSRNPMYVGMALMLAGFGFLFGNLWVLALVPVSLVLNYLIAVRQEEKYLEEQFGEPYLAYKQRVRRWI
jgi:protein-S-isoprenylcysteine O-methyltransferase Ste14